MITLFISQNKPTSMTPGKSLIFLYISNSFSIGCSKWISKIEFPMSVIIGPALNLSLDILNFGLNFISLRERVKDDRAILLTSTGTKPNFDPKMEEGLLSSATMILHFEF
eukprot:NODE_20_length_44879_cov_0.624654.p35 type:complete len:110 gc:universal NODE_20_length_44879_cov_0.624654:5875-6204(+)